MPPAPTGDGGAPVRSGGGGVPVRSGGTGPDGGVRVAPDPRRPSVQSRGAAPQLPAPAKRAPSARTPGGVGGRDVGGAAAGRSPLRVSSGGGRAAVSTGLTARLEERSRAARRRSWTRLWFGLCVVVVVGALIWVVFFSPLFELSPDRVVVSGQGTVIAPGAVEEVVAGEHGVPLTRMDTVALRQRILDVPGVRDVEIERDWPRGLSVSLTAREPVAAVPDRGGYTLRDDEGLVVGRIKRAPSKLPVIDIPRGVDVARTLDAALFMLNAVPAPLHSQIKSISAPTPDAVTMELRDGAKVLWGNQAQAELKVRVFEVLRKAPETKDAKVFDVSAPNAPITR